MQVPVGQRGVAEDHGHRVRIVAHGPREGAEHVLRVGRQRSAVSGRIEQRLFRRGEREQVGQGQRGVGRGAPQHPFQRRGEGADGVLVEQVTAVLADALGDLAPPGQFQGQVRAAQPVVQVDGLDAHTRQGDLRLGHVAVAELHLVDGRMAEVAVGPELAHQPFEGDPAVAHRAQGVLAHPGEQLPEARVPGQAGTQDQAVDEHADQPGDFGAVTARGGHADDDVLPARVAHQHGLPRGQGHHERRRLRRAGQGLHGVGEALVQREAHPAAAVGG